MLIRNLPDNIASFGHAFNAAAVPAQNGEPVAEALWSCCPLIQLRAG
jgi:hypothetical protein